MNYLTREQLLTGRDTLPEDPIELRAGPVTVLYEQGVLRHIKLGDTPIVHQIYAAVRDQNWGTVNGKIDNYTIYQSDYAFEIRFQQHHVQGDIDFVWQASIKGSEDGTIVYDFDGVANTTFKRNRIGFCVLHPATCAGLPCQIEHVDGKVSNAHFPVDIAPHQPFFAIRSITHPITDSLQASVTMQGDTFEMEDQRNWTDASFKTYCTPLGMPFPVTVNAGESVHQTITFKLIGEFPEITTTSQSTEVTLQIGEATNAIMPSIGLTYASTAGNLTDEALELLKAMQIAHLRIDVHFAKANWRDVLQQGLRLCEQIGIKAEIALKLTDNALEELATIQSLVDEGQVIRWLIFHSKEKSTSAETMQLARRILTTSKPLIGGTDAFFAELNRERPDYTLMDGVNFTLNPQVHAFDNASLVETLSVQAIAVQTTRTFVADTPIIVSPVTLKMRWNPNATTAEPDILQGKYRPQADARQMSLFAGAWTLGSIKYLAESDIQSLTYYETHGWLGVLADDIQGAVQCAFPSMPAATPYPLYYVLADVARLSGAQIIACQSSDASKVIGLALQTQKGVTTLLANLTHHEQVIRLTDISLPCTLHIRDELGYQQTSLEANTLTLLPYAYVRIEGHVS